MKKVLFFAACLFVMTFVSSCNGDSTPSDEALKCVELMQKGDYEALVNELKMDEDATPE